jgi:6-phosphogluconolactonase (cycloisomerase 2 family)
MKFGKVGQVVLVSAIALAVATLFTACGTLTVDFLFVPTNKQTPGQIEVYEVNSETGGLRTIPTSPFPSGGRDPIAEAVSPTALNGIESLYAANQDDNNIVQFTIGSDGKLYPQSTINTPGTYPMALAMNSAGTYEYVVDILGPVAGCSLANPCPGVIAGYAVTTAATSKIKGSNGPGSLGQVCTSETPTLYSGCTLGNPVVNVVNNQSLTSLPLGSSSADGAVLTPSALHILGNGAFLYVTAYSQSATTNAYSGYLFGFAIGSNGALTPLNGGTPIALGSQPVAIASDSSNSTLFVADEATNLVNSFSIQSNGTLTALGSASTGNQPSALALINDKYLYVTNSLDSTVTAFANNSGTLAKVGTYDADANPIAVIGDPRNLGFLYTVNFLNGSLSGYKINMTDGSLINTDHSPYLSTVQPTTITGIPHGGSTH